MKKPKHQIGKHVGIDVFGHGVTGEIIDVEGDEYEIEIMPEHRAKYRLPILVVRAAEEIFELQQKQTA